MSLINDALKRASQAEKERPSEPGLPPAMQPAAESRRSWVPVAAGVAVVALLAAAGWLVWRSFSHRGNPASGPSASSAVGPVKAPRRDAAATNTPAPVPAVQSNAGPAKVEIAAKEDMPTVVMPPVNTNANTNPPVPPPAPAIAPAPEPEPPPFPELKLQGIFYSRNNPRATINGEMHRENEQIGEVRITAISTNKVTVDWNGRTKDLYLGE
jgi:hypothetical protein